MCGSFCGLQMTFSLIAAFVFASAVAADTSLTDAIASQPSLSNLTAFLAPYPNLVAQLNTLQNITFLAPDNDAFAAFLNSSESAPVLSDLQSLEQLFLCVTR